jgi:hypothetical protein
MEYVFIGIWYYFVLLSRLSNCRASVNRYGSGEDGYYEVLPPISIKEFVWHGQNPILCLKIHIFLDIPTK